MSPSNASIPKEFPSYAALPEPLRKGCGSIFEAFARNASVNLSAYFRASLSLRHVDTTQLPFARFRQGESVSYCWATAQVEGVARKLLARMPISLVFRMVEILLGGKPGSSNPINREPTEIEKQLIGVLFQRFLQDLDSAFKELTGLRAQFHRLETEASAAQLLAPADSVVIGCFEVSLGGEPGQFTLILPEEVSRRVLEILQRPAIPVDTPMDAAAQRPILELLMPANVCIEAWLDGASMRVGDLLNLREGQVIVLDHGTDHSVNCTVNGDPGFAGQIVSTGKKRAFLIEDHEGPHAGSFAPVPGASGA